MKKLRKAFSLVIIALLLASVAILNPIAHAPATADPVHIKINLPNGQQNMTITHPQKYNVSIVVVNVTNLYSWALDLNWSKTICNYTGENVPPTVPYTLTSADRIWLDPGHAFSGHTVNVATGGINNTLATLSIGQSGTGRWTSGPTGNITICIIEFQVRSNVVYGNNWIRFIGLGSTSGTYLWSITGAAISFTDVKAPSPYQAYNAMVSIPAPAVSAPTATLSYTPSSPPVNQTVTITVTQTEAGWNGTANCPITNVTVNYGDTSPLQWKAPNASGVATFTHKYKAVGSYTIKAYCYAAHQPAGYQWCNLTAPISVPVVPEFSTYLLMPLFLIATAIAVAVAKIMWSKKPKTALMSSRIRHP